MLPNVDILDVGMAWCMWVEVDAVVVLSLKEGNAASNMPPDDGADDGVRVGSISCDGLCCFEKSPGTIALFWAVLGASAAIGMYPG